MKKFCVALVATITGLMFVPALAGATALSDLTAATADNNIDNWLAHSAFRLCMAQSRIETVRSWRPDCKVPHRVKCINSVIVQSIVSSIA
jgi:hypothetical protein